MTDHGMQVHEWEEQLPAFALGALDEPERQALEAHLAGCARCRAALTDHEETVALLAQSVTPVPLPVGMRERVLARAVALPQSGGRGGPPQSPAAPHHAPADAPRETPVIPLASRRRASVLPLWGALAASLIVAAVLGARWRGEREQRVTLAREVNELQRGLARRDSLLASVLAPDVSTAQLVSTGREPSVRLYWNRRHGTIVLAAASLSPAPAGRTYQLWGIEQGQPPRSLGTFNTDPEGRATVVLRVADPGKLALSAVTEEPAGGSPQPTTTPFAVGEWQGAE